MRLADPVDSDLVTGLKHDIALLDRVRPEVPSAGAASDDIVVTVLDLSFARNRAGVDRLLAQGIRVVYIDHHMPGVVPGHTHLTTHIDTTPSVCTSVIADRLVGGVHRWWAITGAFGDNLAATALSLADGLGLAPAEREALCELGECLNYNAYGDSIDDVAIHPADLYRRLARYDDPLAFTRGEPVFADLRRRRADDFALARDVEPLHVDPHCAVYRFPDAGWSRRVLGPFANRLVFADPQRAHAVLKERAGGGYSVSLRAPLASPQGADTLAQRFGGAGRESAAGIDHLPASRLDELIAAIGSAGWVEG